MSKPRLRAELIASMIRLIKERAKIAYANWQHKRWLKRVDAVEIDDKGPQGDACDKYPELLQASDSDAEHNRAP